MGAIHFLHGLDRALLKKEAVKPGCKNLNYTLLISTHNAAAPPRRVKMNFTPTDNPGGSRNDEALFFRIVQGMRYGVESCLRIIQADRGMMRRYSSGSCACT